MVVMSVSNRVTVTLCDNDIIFPFGGIVNRGASHGSYPHDLERNEFGS